VAKDYALAAKDSFPLYNFAARYLTDSTSREKAKEAMVKLTT